MDKNTKYFHGSTKQRRVRNRIICILNEARVWKEEETEIEQTAIEYFQDILPSFPISDLETSLEHVHSLVTPEINAFLLRKLSASEVKVAIFSIHPEKAPDPDGMITLFYQKIWHIVGPQVVEMVHNFMSSGIMDPKNNEVNICLIPKIERPRGMKDFRPISRTMLLTR